MFGGSAMERHLDEKSPVGDAILAFALSANGSGGLGSPAMQAKEEPTIKTENDYGRARRGVVWRNAERNRLPPFDVASQSRSRKGVAGQRSPAVNVSF